VTEPRKDQPKPRGNAVIELLTTANSVTVTVLAILLALVVGALIIVFSNQDVLDSLGYFFAAPGPALSAMGSAIGTAYGALFKGAILDPGTITAAANGQGSWWAVLGPLSETLTYAAPLICTGLAVALAFRAGLFNIGAQGQAMMGAICAVLVGFSVDWPPVIGVIVSVLAGLVGGGLWGFIAGWLKARTGAHEVITTIMLNYVAAPSFVAWLVVQHGVQRPGRNDAITKLIHGHAALPQLFGSGSGLRVNFAIILAVAAAFGVQWLLNRSTLGFEFRAVGANPNAARTAGMSVARTYVLVMLASGALAGLAGANIILGTAHTLSTDTMGTIGFDGITVALLGRGKPFGSVLAGLLFGALQAGAVQMQTEANISTYIATVLQALIVLFVAAPALVKAIFRLRAQRAGALGQTLAKGWNG
jgi:simple sugar transport system permease protein